MVGIPFFDRQDSGSPSRQDFRLLAILILVGVASRLGVLLGGFATDDYAFALTVEPGNLDVYFSQGRFISGAIVSILGTLGAKAPEQYLLFGALAITLQAMFMASILRFTGLSGLSGAVTIGALMVAHPYGTEIFTFKVALPPYCAALAFCIYAMERILHSPGSRRARLEAGIALTLMLATYQIFINHLAITVLLALVISELSRSSQNVQEQAIGPEIRRRALSLMAICIASVLVYYAVVRGLDALGVFSLDVSRTRFIPLEAVPERLQQIYWKLVLIYMAGEPALPDWMKLAILITLAASILKVAFHLRRLHSKRDLQGLFLITCVLTSMLPMSLGMILLFQGWWPVPRVLGHVAIIIGLITIAGDFCSANSQNRQWKALESTVRLALVGGFLLINNQIFQDQLRVNDWDRSLASRIVARLESDPGFGGVTALHVDGRVSTVPKGVTTLQGDMNISAFNRTWSQVSLFSYVTGGNYAPAGDEAKRRGSAYCDSAPPWPAGPSTRVIDKLAIICLGRP